MLRVLLDTNVLVAAAEFPESPPSELVVAAGLGQCEVIITEPLLREVERAFAAAFGRAAGKDGYRLLARMPRRHVVWEFEWEHLVRDVRGMVSDRGDVPHVCAYLAGRADLFVTLDRKLAKMPVRKEVRFVHPAEAINLLKDEMNEEAVG